MPDAFARLRKLVEGALDQPEDARAAWIAAACAGDTALREEVDALVVASLADDTFLDSAAPLERAAAAAAVPPGTRIGSYTILGTIGTGGMGTVFEAQQDTPRRVVALKVMQANLLARDAAARFQYEVEVLGTLRHPGIAQIYDAGVHELEGGLGELPWFAMERVEDARTLIQHARDESLEQRPRIELFLHVCDAVQHGHQKGIIHRDLKPDNLLVGARGRVKVIDFGVARVADQETLEATLRTQADEIVGTLAYMSPEQVEGGDTDTRSDVYALGVVLYQLLTDHLPIEVHRSDFLTSARRIVQEAPRRPRAFLPQLRRDLEAILLRCLEKEPTRRYASAGALAADLRRHLSGEAVEARPPTAMHQLRLFARRNKVLVGASCAVFLVAVAAAIVSLQFGFASKRSEARAQTNAEEARKAEKRAQENAEEARLAEVRAQEQAAEAEEQRDRFQTLFRAQFATSVEAISVNMPDLIEVPGGAAIAERMLDQTIERLKALARMSADDPEITLEIVNAYQRLAQARGSTGNPGIDAQRMGMGAIEEGLALIERLIERHPQEAGFREQRAGTLAFLAQSAYYTTDIEVAIKHIEAARAQLDTLPDGYDAPVTEAFVCEVEAGVRMAQMDWAAAHALADRSATLLAEVVARFPDTPSYAVRRALSLRRRGRAELKRRRFGDARKTFQEAAAVVDKIAKAHPERVSYRCVVLSCVLLEARAVKAVGRAILDQLPPVYARAKALDDALLREAPLHLSVRLNHAQVLKGLGSLRTTEAMRDHARGSPGRIQGLREALALYEEGVAVYVQIEREGRLRKVDRADWEHMNQVVAFYRKAIAASGGEDAHHKPKPKKDGEGDASEQPKKDG